MRLRDRVIACCPGSTQDGVRRLVEGNLSVVVAVRRDGVVETMSPGARVVFGNAGRGRPLALRDILVTPEAVTRRRGTHSIMTLALRGDGTPFSSLVTMTNVGRLRIVVFTDEMERLHGQRKERESAALLASVLRAVTDPVFVRDSASVLVAMNDAAATLAGVPRNILEGLPQDQVDLILPRWLSSTLRDDFDAAALGNSRMQDVRTGGDGATSWGRWVSYPLPGQEGRPGCISICRDVTRERCDAALLTLAKDQAERAHREKSRFLAAASHDLRQPVQSMLLQMATLQASELDPKAELALSRLMCNLDTMKGLLDNLLDLKHLNSGSVQPNVVDFDLDAMLAEIEANAAPIAADKGLAFRISCEAGVQVRSDRVRLGQMIGNMVQNAIRYTNAGSVDVLFQAQCGQVRIEVRDTGIGIPPDRIPHIWDEFVQLANPERDRNQGVGLGLSIVARLSRLLDHPVDVRSSPGVGSSFFVDVPAARAMGMPLAPRVQGRITSHAEGRVAVVVDDDDMVLTGIEAYLEDAGYIVIAAESAEGAICEMERLSLSPDIIVADYRLRSGRTGLDAVRSLRAHVGDEIPAAVLTGETDEAVARAVSEEGLSLLLYKPVTGLELTQALRGIWRPYRARSRA